MEKNSFSEELMKFGLTRQESAIYECMLGEKKTTGYEIAKQLGISRSNAYNSLASMTEKGAVYLVEEDNKKKYMAVALEEFCKNYIRSLEESKRWLLAHKPECKDYTEGYITIEGSVNILNKLRNILSKVEERVYISCTRNYLLLLSEEIDELVSARKKVVIITDQPISLKNVKVYIGEPREFEIGIIADSKFVISGEYGDGSKNTCLYSGQENFVKIYKRALANEIKILTLKEENR